MTRPDARFCFITILPMSVDIYFYDKDYVDKAMLMLGITRQLIDFMRQYFVPDSGSVNHK
ncbi:MAG: hypothetical protein DRQ58_09585 [Gammaproteobacteria bacterium]|nr:MAG: hypothetical protein DRQ58_09585 [Gammaproteobacteria bacterium]